MATPLFDALVAKTRDWSNKPEVNTIPDSVIKDCLKFSADECYRNLRIPPLEVTVQYEVSSGDNVTVGGLSYTSFSIPEDMTQFIYLKTEDDMFNEITDKRSFFDNGAEKYSTHRWIWQDDKIFVHPKQAVGTIIDIHYYRRLPTLSATYDVIPINYLVGISNAAQPFMQLAGIGETGIALYFSTLGIVTKVFSNSVEAAAYATPVTSNSYVGTEVSNWLRDSNERLLIWGGLYNLGAYLFDNNMEQRYEKRFIETLTSLNKEEKWRRASGGNIQINANTYGLI